jgi:ATP phosphoribosyltransferase regulatory subunit
VLQVKGSQLRPERQFGQVGAELIGATGANADAEVVLVAAEALREAGVEHLTVDLNLPTLIAALVQGLGLDSELLPRLRSALDRKDETAVATLALRGAETIVRLMRSAGPADRSLPMLLALDLPGGAQEERQRLSEVVALVRAAAPDLILTIDPVEHRGFEYHTGVSFTVFARGVRGELGRGGRYDSGKGESSTGFTLYTDSLMRALPATDRRRRLYVSLGASATTAAALRREGWVTVAGLAAVADPTAEARRLGCSHVLLGDGVEAVDPRR